MANDEVKRLSKSLFLLFFLLNFFVGCGSASEPSNNNLNDNPELSNPTGPTASPAPVATPITTPTPPPQLTSVTLANGAVMTPDVVVKLDVIATNAAEMRITGDIASGDSGWIPFVQSSTITLNGAQGFKTVQVTIRNSSGNSGSAVTGTIFLDDPTVPPTLTTVTLAGGADGVTSTATTVLVATTPDAVGLEITGSIVDPVGWVLLEEQQQITLTTGTGKVMTDFGNNDGGYSMAIQSDGKILVAGYSFVVGSGFNFALARYNTDGSLDASFGNNGKVQTPVSDGFGYGMTIQPDGKIIVVGASFGWNFALARYNVDGSLDTSFDGDGKVTTDFGGGGSDHAYSVAVQPDGRIVVAGDSWNYSLWGYDFALARYNVDGSLDTSFDGDGKVTTDFGGGFLDHGYSLAIQPDGKIIVAGKTWNDSNKDFALARYNTDGLLDTSFDGDGKVITTFSAFDETAHSIAIQPDGSIIVAGETWNGSNQDFALARYNPSGSLDTGFGSGNGKVITHFGGGSSDYGYSLAIQPDSKIIVAGESSGNFALARYNTDGSLDTGFGDNGKIKTDFGTYAVGYSVAIQPDGKIIVAGKSSGDFALARYNTDGSLDTSFGGDGLKTVWARVKDAAGNSTETLSDTVILDTHAPVGALKTTVTQTTNPFVPVSLVWSDSPNNVVSVRWSGDIVEAGQVFEPQAEMMVTLTPGPGFKVIQVEYIDWLGSYSTPASVVVELLQ